jgi:carboxylesterase
MSSGHSRLGVLLLHGFTGNPDTIRPLEAPLKNLDLQISVPLLRGHGANSPEALRGVTWPDWLADGTAALAELRNRADRVMVVGHSMGALVALQLAANQSPGLDSLVLMATPLQLASPLAPGRPLQGFRPLLQRLLRSWPIPKSYADPRLGGNDGSYPWAPMGALISFLDLVERTGPRLKEVSLPTLILHSHGDPVVMDTSAETVLADLATLTAEKRIVWFQRSGHELLRDVDRDAVLEAVLQFVGERLNHG